MKITAPLNAPQVYIDPDDALHTLRYIRRKSLKLGPPLIAIKSLMVADHVRNFDSGGALFGGWAPREAEFGLEWKTMFKSGRLRDSLKAKGKQGSGGATYIESKKGVVRAGTGITNPKDNKPYPRFHQSGAKREGRGGILPKREVVGITTATYQKSLSIIDKYLTGIV